MLINNNEYLDIIESVKCEIKNAQYKAAVSVNKELVLLYYNIGKIINEHKTWGSKFIENLSADIHLSFPDTKGYSVRNLKYMAKFAAEYPDEEFVQQVVAQVPWGQNIVLLDRISDFEVKKWYAHKIIENGWSRNVLIHQIESGLYERQEKAEKISNFENRLASPQSELAVQTMKDPYIFDFIPFKKDIVERDIEQALVTSLTSASSISLSTISSRNGMKSNTYGSFIVCTSSSLCGAGRRLSKFDIFSAAACRSYNPLSI